MKRHPAKFSAPIVDEIVEILVDEMESLGRAPLVLDPFAGVGGVHDAWHRAVGVELEPEWARQSEPTIIANSLSLPFGNQSFDSVVTSPCYGNRMADHHEAKERCRNCEGSGSVEIIMHDPLGNPPQREVVRCEKCEGKGFNEWERMTYRHKLGRMPSENSSAVMQWGKAYRRFHIEAWKESTRILKPGGLFVLNVGDHIRGGQQQFVSKWHDGIFLKLGYTRESRIKVRTQKMRKGANRKARIPYEWVITYRKEAL